MTHNINLHQSEAHKPLHPLDPVAAIGYVALAIVALGVTLLVVNHQLTDVAQLATVSDFQLATVRVQTEESTRRLAGFVPDPKLQRQIELTQQEILKRRQALALLSGKGADSVPEGFVGRLEALARQSLPGLWLTMVSVAPDNVAIAGRALDPETVPVYVRRLSSEAAMQGDRLTSLEIKRDSEEAGSGTSAPSTTSTSAATMGALPAAPSAPASAASSAYRTSNYVGFILRGSAAAGLLTPSSEAKP